MRLVGGGALEQIAVFNTSPESIGSSCGSPAAPTSPTSSRSGARSATAARTSSPPAAGRRSLRFRYQVPGFLAETTIQVERSEIVEAATERVVGGAAPIDGDGFVWALECHHAARS